MAKKKTVEKKVSEAILQQQQQITVDGKTYTYGKPSVATIIMISELASELPIVDTAIKQSDIVGEVLRIAKDSKVIGRIVATIILGAKRIKQMQGEIPKTHWWQKRKKNELDELSEAVLLTMTPQEIAKLISEQLINLEIGSFFGVTASLANQNALKPTKSGDEAEE
jgi:hypothetical protein